MSLRTDLVAYWKATSGITSLVSTRIYAGLAPQSATKPYVCYTFTSNRSEQHMTAADTLSAASLTLEIYAATLSSAETVAEAFRAAMDGYRDKLMGSTNIRRIILEDDEDSFTVTEGSQAVEWLMLQSYRIWYYRSVPTP